MKRINEHIFELNGKQYHLTFYETPIIKTNGVYQMVLPVLREYVEKEKIPIEFVNSKGNKKNTHTIAKEVLEYFSVNNTINSINSNLISIKKERVEIKNNKLIQKDSEKPELKLSKNFKVVIICASDKNDGGDLIYNGQKIKFYAQSNIANTEFLPDDYMPDTKTTWRDFVNANQNPNSIPMMAYQLYKRDEYRQLFKRFGNLFYILSAGWGLVRADYRLPKYDITFSNNADLIKKRNYNLPPNYLDFNHLDNLNDNEDIIYIGGKDYLPLFYELTQNLQNRKIIYYYGNITNSQYDNYIYRKYFPNNQNNQRKWHYELAEKIANGIIP